MPDPIKSAWAYPIFGLLHLLTHPQTLRTSITILPKPPTLLSTLFKTFLYTLVLTTVLLLAQFKLTDHVIFLLARKFAGEKSILARNNWLRGGVAVAGVAVQAALIAGKVVEYGVDEGARRVGEGVLREEIGKMGEVVGERKSEGSGSGVGGLTSATGNTVKKGEVTNVEVVGERVSGDHDDDGVKNSTDSEKTAEEKNVVKKTLSAKGVSWAMKKAVSIPVAALVPVLGPVVYAAVHSHELGSGYVEGYARAVGLEQEVQENLGSVKAFGLVAGILHALPVVGPLFYFSNYVGGALWVAALKGYQEKRRK